MAQKLLRLMAALEGAMATGNTAKLNKYYKKLKSGGSAVAQKLLSLTQALARPVTGKRETG